MSGRDGPAFKPLPAGWRVQLRSSQQPEWDDIVHRAGRSFLTAEEAEAAMRYWEDYFARQDRTDVEFRVVGPDADAV